MSLELHQPDIIRLILQYLKESSLHETYQCLQNETQISLNQLDSPPQFFQDIKFGRWDSVLRQISSLKIPASKLMTLYEQIIYELLEISEKEIVSRILSETLLVNGLRNEFPERCLTLDHLSKRAVFDAKSIYIQGSKEKSRQKIADLLLEEISSTPSSRLILLLGQALKYQESQGIIKAGSQIDIFANKTIKTLTESSKYPLCVDRTLKLAVESRIESLCFSENSEFLALGCRDGIIEIWDPTTGKIKNDLAYQAEEAFMIHNDPIISISFTKDSELLASGDNKGIVKLWRVRNGKCLRKIEEMAGKAITCLKFGKDISHLIVAEKEIKVFGLKSGRIIKEFSGHTSTVNELLLSQTNQLISCSNDGKILIWDYQSNECIKIIVPMIEKIGFEIPVLSMNFILNMDSELLSVCSRSNSIHIIDLHGKILKKFICEKKEVEFIGACISLQKKNSSSAEWIYALGNDCCVYCFNLKTGKIDHSLRVCEQKCDFLGIKHHPTENLIIVYATDGSVMFLTP